MLGPSWMWSYNLCYQWKYNCQWIGERRGYTSVELFMNCNTLRFMYISTEIIVCMMSLSYHVTFESLVVAFNQITALLQYMAFQCPELFSVLAGLSICKKNKVCFSWSRYVKGCQSTCLHAFDNSDVTRMLRFVNGAALSQVLSQFCYTGLWMNRWLEQFDHITYGIKENQNDSAIAFTCTCGFIM